MIHRPTSHYCHCHRYSVTLGVLVQAWHAGQPQDRSHSWTHNSPSSRPLGVSPFSLGGCRISVCAFSMKCSSWATWQAVSGLSPVIMTTWGEGQRLSGTELQPEDLVPNPF